MRTINLIRNIEDERFYFIGWVEAFDPNGRIFDKSFRAIMYFKMKKQGYLHWRNDSRLLPDKYPSFKAADAVAKELNLVGSIMES